MKITTVSLSRTIPTGPYMNDKITMEASLHPGESHSTVLDNLSALINEWHKKSNPHLYQENQPPPIPERPFAYRQDPIPTISKEVEPKEKRLLALMVDISSCQEVKVLESYKLMVKADPQLQTAYDNRLKELTT